MTFQSYLKDFPNIKGDPVTVSVEYAKVCVPGAMGPSLLIDIVHRLGSEPVTLNLPNFFTDNQASCPVKFDYSLETTVASKGGNPDNYFSFDPTQLALKLAPRQGGLAEQIFTVKLTGTITKDKALTHELSFKIKFMKRLEAEDGVGADETIHPVIQLIDQAGLVVIRFDATMVEIK